MPESRGIRGVGGGARQKPLQAASSELKLCCPTHPKPCASKFQRFKIRLGSRGHLPVLFSGARGVGHLFFTRCFTCAYRPSSRVSRVG
eukprot:12515437-Alexandrium_andersonii.AAC.2